MTTRQDREVRHKSDDISADVLLDAIRAIGRRIRVTNRKYDIPYIAGYSVPYIAGYSVDGKTVFIDRHLPRTFRWKGRSVRVEPFLLTHEIIEKTLLDQLQLHYLHAHQIALRAEKAAVEAAGVSWDVYNRFMKRYEKPIDAEKLVSVPPDLDLTPYRDEKDFALLHQLVKLE